MNQSGQDPLVGTLFDNRYLINYLVARGGMGNIYQAHDTKRGHIVAIKLLRAEYGNDRVMVQRFLREANVVQSLKHENICQLYDMGLTPGGEHYFTMEFLEGHALDQLLEQQKVLTIDVAVNYVIQVARGLSDAHAHGIVHRDMKPANIFVLQTPNTPDFVKVLDFGVAKTPEGAVNTWDPKLTNAGSTVGTPFYMSPEQIRGTMDVDARSDIYSLGVILWECVFGAPPFLGNSLVEVFELALNKPLPKLTARYKKHPVYVKLYKILTKALEKDPRHRYQTMQEFICVLEQCVPQVKSTLPTAGELPEERTPGQTVDAGSDNSKLGEFIEKIQRNPFYIALTISGVCVIILGIVFAVLLIPSSDPLHYTTYKVFADVPCVIEADGRVVGNTPTKDHTPAKLYLNLEEPFEVKITPKDGDDKEVTFDVKDDLTGFAVNFEPKNSDAPQLFIDSDPPGARVDINGNSSGEKTPCQIPITSDDKVVVTLFMSGYITERILVDHRKADIHINTKLLRRDEVK